MSSNTAAGPRVFDGRQWLTLLDDSLEQQGDQSPVEPVLDGDGKIFVSLASYRGKQKKEQPRVSSFIVLWGYATSNVFLSHCINNSSIYSHCFLSDGERCGQTLKSLFQNAEHPDKIVVGLAEQNAPDDKFCLEVYCEQYGTFMICFAAVFFLIWFGLGRWCSHLLGNEVNRPKGFIVSRTRSLYVVGFQTVKRNQIRKDSTKVIVKDDPRSKCPRYDQVRVVAFHHIQAKGPTYTRSLVRKVLGNEEFCMQVDAHTEFAPGWDTMVLEEWKNTHNEFGVVSNVPLPVAEKSVASANEVPRQCAVRFLDNGFPVRGCLFGLLKFAMPLTVWFLHRMCFLRNVEPSGLFNTSRRKICKHEKTTAGAWLVSSIFVCQMPFRRECSIRQLLCLCKASRTSITICSHVDTRVCSYSTSLSEFSQYSDSSRYDVYTPTRNIVFHEYGEQANGHGNNEWFRRQRDRFRQASIVRAKTLLEIPGGSTTDAQDLGIYGLGKRRTLQQLQQFMRVNLSGRQGNQGTMCASHQWVPYDATISPTDNLYAESDHHRDPQPEYPLRTKLVYYDQVEINDSSTLLIDTPAMSNQRSLQNPGIGVQPDGFEPGSNLPSTGLLFVVWVFGLFVWYLLFGNGMAGGSSSGKRRSRYSAVGMDSSKDV